MQDNDDCDDDENEDGDEEDEQQHCEDVEMLTANETQTLSITGCTNSSNIATVSTLLNNTNNSSMQQQQQQLIQAELLLPNNNELSIIPINPSTSLASLPTNTTNGTP